MQTIVSAVFFRTHPNFPEARQPPSASYFPEGTRMTQEKKTGRLSEDEVADELVNDSLGTTTQSDSTGSDETKETGDAKKGNTKTRED